MNGTPNITWPTTARTNGLHLSGYILADVKLLLIPRESAAGNLQKQAALQHTCKQPSWHERTIAHSAEEIQRIVDAFANASSKLGLKINIKKTEVIFQPNSRMTMEEDINVDETTLNHVKEFTYLGSIIASDGHIEAELQTRMLKASMSFGRLRERLWNNHNLSIRVKRKIYCAIILSPPYCTGMRHGRCIGGMWRSYTLSWWDICGQSWRSDGRTKIKVLKRAGLPSMEDLLIRKNLRWIGHLLRMPTDRLPRQILYSQLPDGQRPRGRPRLRYKDTI